MKAKGTIYVDTFVDGILDPRKTMLGPVKDGGHIIANTTPGCWGPMISPDLKGAHEVTQPVFVEGANIGDAIAVHIKSIQITSFATSSGVHKSVEGRFIGDPGVAAKCPSCGIVHPNSKIEGIGQHAIRCSNCGGDITPYVIENGYTMVFDSNRELGVTVNKDAAYKIAKNGREFMSTPENSIQNPAVTFAPHDLIGVVSCSRPFLGQLGTTPSIPMPDSRNAGDLGSLLINAPHEYGLTKEQLEERTDGHMDISRVREGAIVICPVKVEGGGVYLGDMHAMQGDGEIAGHTTDVSGIVTIQVNVIKRLKLEGPILLPVPEDLPHLAKPLNKKDKEVSKKVAKLWGMDEVEESLPISFVGTGTNLNKATDNGIQRAANLLGMTEYEVMNRCTITGSIEIGRYPGVITVTFRVPKDRLDHLRLTDLVMNQYRSLL